MASRAVLEWRPTPVLRRPLPAFKPRIAAVAGSLAALGALLSFTGVWDPDLFHHLAVGRAIARGVSFAEDPLLFTMAGAPGSLPAYWLGSLAIHLSGGGGLLGPQLLVALVTAVLAALLFSDAVETRSSWRELLVVAPLVALALVELRVRSAPRPEAFGVLFLAWTALAIRRFESGRPRLLHFFPLVALLWNQLHVTIAMGLGLVAFHVAWSAVPLVASRLRREPIDPAPLRDLRTSALILVGGLVAAALNPSANSPLRLAGHFLGALLGVRAPGAGSGDAEVIALLRGAVEELQAPSLSDWTRPFGLLLALALLSVPLHRSRHWGRELATVLTFAFFASTSHRFIPMASVIAVPIAARNLLGWLDGLQRDRPRAGWAVAGLVAAVGLARAASAPTLPLQPLSTSLDTSAFPVRAAQYLRDLGFDGRLYNAFGVGGYLEWALDRPVFQDGRGLARPSDLPDLFPEPVDAARLARLDSRWGFDALVISTELPAGADGEAAGRLRETWGSAADPRTWALVALDDGAALFLRRTGRWATRAASDEFRLLRPGLLLPPDRGGSPERLRELQAEAERSLREAPHCVQCRMNVGALAMESGRLADASEALAPLVAAPPRRGRASLELLMAMVRERQGDAAGSERHYRAAIARAADPAPIRRALALQLMARGREQEARELILANLRAVRGAGDLALAAMLSRQLGDAVGAASLEEESTQAQRRDAAVAGTLRGRRLLEAGQLADARAAFVDAAAADPRHPAPLVGLGFVELSAGNPAGAGEAFERALRLAPGEADAWYGLGRSYESFGDTHRARDAYRRQLELQPVGPLSSDARARLERFP